MAHFFYKKRSGEIKVARCTTTSSRVEKTNMGRQSIALSLSLSLWQDFLT